MIPEHMQEETNVSIRVELYHDGVLALVIGNFMSHVPKADVEKFASIYPITSITKCNKTRVKGIIQSRENGFVLFETEAEVEDPSKIIEQIGNAVVRINVEVERLKMQRTIRARIVFD